MTAAKSQLDEVDEPTFGGTLNATTDQAAEDARREEQSDQNKTMLHHSYLAQPDGAAPVTPGSTIVGTPAGDSTSHGDEYILSPQGVPNIAPPTPQPVSPFGPQVAPQPPSPVDLGLPMPPSLADLSAPIPTLAGPYAPEPTPFTPPAAPSGQPERLGDILSSDDSSSAAPASPFAITPAPTPQFPPTPSAIQPTGPYAAPVEPLPAPTAPPASGDPGQFKIPGQQ